MFLIHPCFDWDRMKLRRALSCSCSQLQAGNTHLVPSSAYFCTAEGLKLLLYDPSHAGLKVEHVWETAWQWIGAWALLSKNVFKSFYFRHTVDMNASSHCVRRSHWRSHWPLPPLGRSTAHKVSETESTSSSLCPFVAVSPFDCHVELDFPQPLHDY